jgi:hypothetical protein
MYVDFGRRIFDAFFDGNPLEQLCELQFLLLLNLMRKMSIKVRKISQGRKLTGTNLNSFERAKTLNNSSVDIVERRCWL